MPQTVQATIGAASFGARQALNRHRRRRHRAFGFVEKYVPPHAQGGLGQVTRRRRPLIVKSADRAIVAMKHSRPLSGAIWNNGSKSEFLQHSNG